MGHVRRSQGSLEYFESADASKEDDATFGDTLPAITSRAHYDAVIQSSKPVVVRNLSLAAVAATFSQTCWLAVPQRKQWCSQYRCVISRLIDLSIDRGRKAREKGKGR
jgi:hypothetical protein